MKDALKRAVERAKQEFDGVVPHTTSSSLVGGQSTTLDISEKNVYRYRKQRGLNLGSWFVLERWICDRPFSCARPPAQSDLDVARGTNAKDILETHWDTWIGDDDWKWIADRGINAVRIPIGYYHICGADRTILNGTDFYPFYDTYAGAWRRVVQAIHKASSLGIGVLIDLHAAPGKQNNDAHAGTSDHANFFGDPHNQRVTIHALRALVTSLKTIQLPPTNIIGIELLNEPAAPSDHALQSWYTSAIASVRELDPTLPIYLGECWRTDSYTDYVVQHHSSSPGLTVLDHHLYRCFTSSDIHTSAQEHARALGDPNGEMSKMFLRVSEKLGRAGGGVVVGEWSGALNPGSLRGTPGEEKFFVNAQLELFETTCAGWFFWTYKKQHPGDTGWSFRDSVEAGIFPSFVSGRKGEPSTFEIEQRHAARNAARDRTLGDHTRYWAQFPGKYNHQRFDDGFCCGWDDAYSFIVATPASAKTISEIGFKGAWARKRTADHGRSYWEFEHGFVQGSNAAVADYHAFNR
ncbi:unnamed protein product [Cyclocybe aegerita]|uniref:Glycoside hydrolase family 5 domain-containing protein n=1 Tax=Cyclocybe aegerita TaxID=1973307 RepID=A0A8S0WCB6_CYCAE|nr:unnamed protein product [Cyclocybe aegerita]